MCVTLLIVRIYRAEGTVNSQILTAEPNYLQPKTALLLEIPVPFARMLLSATGGAPGSWPSAWSGSSRSPRPSGGPRAPRASRGPG